MTSEEKNTGGTWLGIRKSKNSTWSFCVLGKAKQHLLQLRMEMEAPPPRSVLLPRPNWCENDAFHFTLSFLVTG